MAQHKNQLIVSALCKYLSLDSQKFSGDVETCDVKSLCTNIVKSSENGSSLLSNDEIEDVSEGGQYHAVAAVQEIPYQVLHYLRVADALGKEPTSNASDPESTVASAGLLPVPQFCIA